MDDRNIVELFLNRSEEALEQTTSKYGRYCHRIAYNILGNDEDSEECVNDALMRVWGSIPPNEPNSLSSFIGKITRNLALDKLRQKNSDKRGGKQREQKSLIAKSVRDRRQIKPDRLKKEKQQTAGICKQQLSFGAVMQ